MGKRSREVSPEPAAGNGLLDRRLFLKSGGAVTAALGGFAVPDFARAELPIEPWMTSVAPNPMPYDKPSHFEDKVVRGAGLRAPIFPKSAACARRITCSPARSRRAACISSACHTGIPDIDPAQHRLLIHGLVKRPLVFTLEALRALSDEVAHPLPRMRRQQRDCSTTSSRRRSASSACTAWCRCSEWTGVPLSMLLDEAGVDPTAQWLLAEGADASGMSRSVPLAKAWMTRMLAPLPERRAGAAVERLSDAAVAARLRGQHEREMAAPDQACSKARP